MILVLRFIGVMNAAIWLGSAVFFTFVAAPAFFSAAVKATPLGGFWPGIMAQFVVERYFYVQYICGSIAIVHQLAEWVYLGRPLRRGIMVLLTMLMLLGLMGGLWFTPKLKQLNLTQYGLDEKFAVARYSTDQRSQAARSFKIWHGVSSSLNLMGMLALGFYYWRLVHPNDASRFTSAGKFRG